MTHDDLVAYFKNKNATSETPDASWQVLIETAEAEAGRPFAAGHRALISAVGGIDLGNLEFADPNPAITASYFPDLVKMGSSWGMPPEATPIALDNGELIICLPDGHLAVLTPGGLTSETWPSFASYMADMLEAG